MPEQTWHVCSLIVQFSPGHDASVSTHLLNIPGTEIVGINTQDCKLVVLMESTDTDSLYEKMESIPSITGVLAVSLVYHQEDEQPEDFI